MNALLPKLNSVCFVVIAVSLAIIAYQQLQPNYLETKDGRFIDARSGKLYLKVGNQLIPFEESTEEKLQKQFPDGKHY